jgi:hypothetical protein
MTETNSSITEKTVAVLGKNQAIFFNPNPKHYSVAHWQFEIRTSDETC